MANNENLKQLLSRLDDEADVIYSDGKKYYITKRDNNYLLMRYDLFGVYQTYISDDADNFTKDVTAFATWNKAKISKRYNFEV